MGVIKEMAEQKGWSLYKLARYLEVDHQYVYSWDIGKYSPNSKHLLKICKALNCTIDDIVKKF